MFNKCFWDSDRLHSLLVILQLLWLLAEKHSNATREEILRANRKYKRNIGRNSSLSLCPVLHLLLLRQTNLHWTSELQVDIDCGLRRKWERKHFGSFARVGQTWLSQLNRKNDFRILSNHYTTTFGFSLFNFIQKDDKVAPMQLLLNFLWFWNVCLVLQPFAEVWSIIEKERRRKTHNYN